MSHRVHNRKHPRRKPNRVHPTRGKYRASPSWGERNWQSIVAGGSGARR